MCIGILFEFWLLEVILFVFYLNRHIVVLSVYNLDCACTGWIQQVELTGNDCIEPFTNQVEWSESLALVIGKRAKEGTVGGTFCSVWQEEPSLKRRCAVSIV